MDIAVLTAFLTPFLPFLVSAGQKASEKAGEKFGEDAWTKAKAIWIKLHPKVEAKEGVKVAVEQVAAKPDSNARKAVLQEELETLFQENPDLATAIAQILAEKTLDQTPQIELKTKGERNQVVGQMTGETVMGNVQGPAFHISGGTITNLVGTGTVNYQEASHQIRNFAGDPQNLDIPDLAGDAKGHDQAQTVKTILVLAANPKGTHELRLGEEVRNLEAALERSRYRDDYRIETRWAVTPTDVSRALLKFKPQIVHFCGHGVGSEMADDPSPSTRKFNVISNNIAEPEGLILEDETGQPHLVSTEALASLFQSFKTTTECVVLNACYSEAQAQAIANYIPYVIGMKRAIIDKAAIKFTIGFYDAIYAGESVKVAYQLGWTAIQMAGIPDQLTPVLYPKS